MVPKCVSISISILFLSILGDVEAKAAPLRVRIGFSAHFLWKLNPKPEEGEAVLICLNNSDGERVLFMGSASGVLIKDLYDGRIDFAGNLQSGVVKFTLRQIRLSDAGIYNAVYSSQSIEGQELIVEDEPRDVTLSLSDNLIFITKDVFIPTTTPNISCKASCIPSCSYKWLMNTSSTTKEISKKDILRFGSFSVTKSGEYICEAENRHGSALSESIHIEMSSIILDNITQCRNGNPVYFECLAESGTASIFYSDWVHELGGIYIRNLNGTIYRNNLNVLNIKNCSVYDSGDYTCSAKLLWKISSKIQKTLRLEVIGPPIIINVTEWKSNDQSFLSVLYHSHPTAMSVEWSQNGVKIGNDNKYIISTRINSIRRTIFTKILDINVFNTTLVVRNFSTDDHSNYSLTIKNSVGELIRDISVRGKELVIAKGTLFSIKTFGISLSASFVAILTSAMLWYCCSRKRRRRINQIALQRIRDRLAELERNKPTTNEAYVDDFEHYQSINEYSGPSSVTITDQEYGSSDLNEQINSSSDSEVIPNVCYSFSEQSSYDELNHDEEEGRYNVLKIGGDTSDNDVDSVFESERDIADAETSSNTDQS